MMWMDLLRGLIASFCERHGIESVSSCCRFGLQWCTEFWMSRSGLRRFLSCNFPYVVCKFWMRLCRATALNQDLVVWGLVCNYVLNFEYQILGSEGSGLGVAISILSFQYSWVWLLFVTRHLHVQFCCFQLSHTSTTFALHHSASCRPSGGPTLCEFLLHAIVCVFFWMQSGAIVRSHIWVYLLICLFRRFHLQKEEHSNTIKPSSPSLGLCSCLCSSCICSNCSIDQDNAYVVWCLNV